MTTKAPWTPSLDSPVSVRRFLAVAAAASVVVLIYASLIPFDYTPLSWEASYEQWRRIPWLNLAIFHRADWVANALVVLPSGILTAAAVDWGRKRRWPLLVAVPMITLALALVVVGIELAQVWFPTRTVSLNDIVAGYVGAVVGPLIWVAFGVEIERGITRFVRLPRFEDRLLWLCVGYLVFVIVYCLMPLDLVVSRAEWQMRLAEGSIRLSPFHGGDALLHAVKGIVLGALRMGPIGLLLALTGRRHLALSSLLLLPVALELLQLPVFSKYVSTVEVVGGWSGGAIGYLLGRNLHYLERVFQRPSLWALAWFGTLAVTLFALLVRHDQVLRDWSQIGSRFASAWTLPLVKYYSGSEYGALTNMLVKLGLFGLLGATAFGWRKTSSKSAGSLIFWFTLLTVVVAAPAVELLQVILPPLVPDVSDALTYFAGYFAGFQLLRILWGGAGVNARPAIGHSITAAALDHRRPTSIPERLNANGEALIRNANCGWVKSITVPLLRGFPARSFVRRVLAVVLVLAGLLLVPGYSLGSGWGLAIFLVPLILFFTTDLWIAVIPVALVVGDLYPWTGRLLFVENDWFLLALLVALLWKTNPRSLFGPARKLFWIPWALLFVSVAISFIHGWKILPASLAGDELSLYTSQWNAVRVAKGFVGGAILAQLLYAAVLQDPRRFTNFARGMQVSAFVVGVLVMIERSISVGLFDREQLYRATGWFVSTHMGAKYLYAYLAMSLPFLFVPLSRRTWLDLSARGTLLVIAYYAIAATMSRGIIVLAGIETLLLVLLTIYTYWNERRRWQACLFAGLALLCGVGATFVVLDNQAIAHRFTNIRRDLVARWNGWRDLCLAGDQSWRANFVGNGLGTVPSIASRAFRKPLRTAELITLEDGRSALRIRPGKAVYIEQVVSLGPPGPWILQGLLRTDGRIDVHGYLCQKSLFDSFRCVEASASGLGPPDRWQPFKWTFDTNELTPPRSAWRHCPVTLAFSASNNGKFVDLANLQLTDAQGHRLLVNADFMDGSSRWFFTSDDHADWRAENMWVHLYLEHGWLGVVSVAWLILGTLATLAHQEIQHHDTARCVLALAITGFVAMGFFGSMLETPWITELFCALLGVAQARCLWTTRRLRSLQNPVVDAGAPVTGRGVPNHPTD